MHLDLNIGIMIFTILVISICFLYKNLKVWIKSIIRRINVHYFLKKQKKRLNVYPDLCRTDLSPVEIGIIPSQLEYELENPCKKVFEHCDGIHFVGVDSEGNVIDMCINRIEENTAQVWIFLKLANGHVYKLFLDDDSRKPYIMNESLFYSSGLQIKCLSPLRKWRISFNGLLHKESLKDELVHAKFSFVWLAMSGVQELNLMYSAKELASAFADGPHSINEKDLTCLQKLQNRYEQWGQMMGTLSLTGEEEKELYFWSARTRIMDTPLWYEDITHAKFYMYFLDGIPLKIEDISVKNFLSNLTHGYTITPYGAVKPVSNCSFDFLKLKKYTEKIQLSVEFDGTKKDVHITFTGEDMFYIGPELQCQLFLKPFKMHMNNEDYGFGILHYSSMSKVKTQKTFQPPLLLNYPEYYSCDKAVLSLEEKTCQHPEIAGGKGSSLALLTVLSKKSDKFVVPKGLVVTTKAFEEHLRINKNVNDAIQRLKDVSCKKIKADLKAECIKCSALFETTHLSEHLRNEIKSSLLDIYDSLENVKFSIRSSACGEDSEDLSAAGQMLTVLGIRGIKNIYQAIIQCWASKFSFEYVQYVRQNGQSILSPMAVVVQEMVPSHFSGVMFTVDPVTGNPSHPYITANYGLGETVVSALADPDTVILKRGKDHTLQVVSKHIGSKKTQVFMKVENGVEQKNYESQSQNCCLTDEWAIKIGDVGILVEFCFCSPRDIEWAVHKDQIYLLQARPITTLHTETNFELIHDQDTPVRSVNEFWTRANTGEVFLGAASPLGISVVVGVMDIYSHRGHILRDKCFNEFCPYFFHILPVTHRQVTLNLIDTLFKGNEKEITDVQRAFEIGLFGRPVLTKEIHQAGIKKYGYASKVKKYMRFFFIFFALYKIPQSVTSLSKQMPEYKIPLETYTSTKKAWDGILGQISFASIVFGVHGMATFLSSYANNMLMMILSKKKKDWDAEFYCDFATMLSSCTDVESADVPKSLQELAKTIAQNLGTEFSSLPVEVAYNTLKKDTGTAGKLFEEFIQRHGHRCVKEFDLFSKSWGMQPESLIPTLQNIVNTPNILNASIKEEMSTEDILSKIKTPLSSFNKMLLKVLLPLSRKYVGQREKTKSMTIKAVDWLRKSCYRLGELMVQEGMLPESELIFFLTLEEIKDILESQKPGLIPKAIRRMRLHPQLNDLKFPEIMKGIPKPIHVQQDTSCYSASFILKGTPVCQGKVKGKAVVVVSLEEASQINNGDILITHATDIGWSPYFPLLSGVVTVLGGLISHGAVVAREYGLPCVVGVENATAAFKTGDIVILNGTDGTVTKVLEEE